VPFFYGGVSNELFNMRQENQRQNNDCKNNQQRGENGAVLLASFNAEKLCSV
jgi:hypothetical protein